MKSILTFTEILFENLLALQHWMTQLATVRSSLDVRYDKYCTFWCCCYRARHARVVPIEPAIRQGSFLSGPPYSTWVVPIGPTMGGVVPIGLANGPWRAFCWYFWKDAYPKIPPNRYHCQISNSGKRTNGIWHDHYERYLCRRRQETLPTHSSGKQSMSWVDDENNDDATFDPKESP